MNTTQKLAAALMAANAPQEMVDKALDGYYDDFKSPLATPIVQLVTEARAAGLSKIADRAINGDFDATKAESDEWAQSTEGKSTIRRLGL